MKTSKRRQGRRSAIKDNQKPAEAGFWKTANSPYWPEPARILYQKLVIAAVVALLVFITIPSSFSQGQTVRPQLMTSWRAESFAPAWYAGKVFPTRGTPVTASFELIENGRIADLRQVVVRWYVNDSLVRNEENGLGIKSLRLTTPNYPGQDMEVRISIPNYKGQPLDALLRIPVTAPEAVIDNAHPGRDVERSSITFGVHPFFFNVSGLGNLNVSWQAANQPAAYGDNPWQLSVNIPSEAPAGFPVDIVVAVNNLFDELEFANDRLTVNIR